MVEITEVETHRLEVSFTERAETVLRQEYPVSMPVNGRIGRIPLEVGDRVSEGESLVSIDPIPAQTEVSARLAALQSTRLRRTLTADLSVERMELAQAQKRVQSLQAESAQVAPLIEAAKLNLENSGKELTRVRNLVQKGALPSRDLESAQLAVERAKAELAARQSEEKVLRSRLEEARAAVASVRAQLDRKLAEAEAQEPVIEEAKSRRRQASYTLSKGRVASPIDGLVLERFERGPKELPAGSPLLTLGRLEDLETECDVLSQDALRLSRGTPVFLDAGVAFPEPIKGEVRLKEPQGFTKRSSLGVEQQRVRVRISLLDPPPDLGVSYELWARFQLEEKTALALPRSCFVRFGSDYKVWRVGAQSKLELVTVNIGLKGNQYWELDGPALNSGDRIVTNPNEELTEGLEVRTTSE